MKILSEDSSKIPLFECECKNNSIQISDVIGMSK